MAISGSLRRLLHIRMLEEEQRKIALESALSELHRLESVLRAARESERNGRQRIARSLRSSDATDRIAGLVECASAQRSAQIIEARIPQAALRVNAARDEYLAKRVERRQVETVIQEAEDAQDAEAARRNQQTVDEWFSARRQRRPPNRQTRKKLDIKNRQETDPIPEEELRSNL
jgi:flagellar export protein FliJ